MRVSTIAILTWATLTTGEIENSIASHIPEENTNLHLANVTNLTNASQQLINHKLFYTPLLEKLPADKAGILGTVEKNINQYSQEINLLKQNISQENNNQPQQVDRQNTETGKKLVRDIKIRFVDKNGKEIPHQTKINFIQEELRLKSGQEFQADIWRSDLQRIRRLTSLENVKTSVQDRGKNVDIIYEIQERRFPAFSFGGGNNEDVGIFATFGYRDENIAGKNQQIKIDTELSGKDINFKAKYTNPARATFPDRLGYSIEAFRDRKLSDIFNKDINLQRGGRVREGRIGGGVAVLKAISEEWQGSLGLNYTQVSIRDRDFNIGKRDIFGNPLSLSGKGIDDLYTISLGLTRDTRDRRINPTKGSLFTLSTEQSIPIGVGEVSLNRLKANYIKYLPVNFVGKVDAETNPELAEMIAINLQAGTILGDFPPAESFILGGLDSVRGYNTGDISSSRSYILGSVEYRFPILQWLGGVAFTDFGSDLGTANNVLGKPAIIRDKPGSGFGYGVGVRVKSPIGIIRGDLGISDGGDIRFEIKTGQRF